jgi:hypothetical protein
MAQAFMLTDIAASLAALCLFPLFIAVPGYVVAWALDLYDFRRRTWQFRLVFCVPLSIAICPIVTYLAGRMGGMTAVWVLYGGVWVTSVGMSACATAIGRGARTHACRVGTLADTCFALAALWIVLALGSLIDWQIGERLYYSTTALDSSVRTAFTHSLATTGIPPSNPFFYPGQPVPLRYHYFWFIPGALVERLGGSWIGPRHAIIAGTIWCGLALMAVLALYLRLFERREGADIRGRVTTGLLLLGVTGLDIIPIGLLVFLHARGVVGVVMPSVDWWNEQICGWLGTMLWEPHYLAGLIVCLTAFLLLWRIDEKSDRREVAAYGALAGVALATALGTSIYVTFVFAVFLAGWMLMAIVRRWRRHAASMAIAAGVSIALAAPYLAGLTGSAGGGSLLHWTVRTFRPAEMALAGQAEPWRLALINLASLPVNYFLELGFFLAIGIWQVRRWRAAGRPLQRHQLAAAWMIAASLLVCTFVRSGVISNNDLGWRGVLIAQFILLLWSVDLLGTLGGFSRSLAVALLTLGVASNVYDLAMLRLYPWLADRGAVPTIGWIAADRQAGSRTYAERAAWEWINSRTRAGAVVAFNPSVRLQDTSAFLYSRRQILAADTACYTIFGGLPKQCDTVRAGLLRVFSGEPESPCGVLQADAVVVKDTDAVWGNSQSWVWRAEPRYANGHVRVFECAPGQVYQMRSGRSPGVYANPILPR